MAASKTPYLCDKCHIIMEKLKHTVVKEGRCPGCGAKFYYLGGDSSGKNNMFYDGSNSHVPE